MTKTQVWFKRNRISKYFIFRIHWYLITLWCCWMVCFNIFHLFIYKTKRCTCLNSLLNMVARKREECKTVCNGSMRDPCGDANLYTVYEQEGIYIKSYLRNNVNYIFFYKLFIYINMINPIFRFLHLYHVYRLLT